MSSIARLASVASLIGEPARTAMLVSLMDGRALTAGELALAAGVSPSTASGHLALLHEAGLLALARQGRHRYYRLASSAVATILEELMAFSGALRRGDRPKPVVTGPRDRDLRRARVCYDHLAGAVAVAIADSMIAHGRLVFAADGGLISEAGSSFLAGFGINVAQAEPRDRKGASVCRPCLDWSERRPHIAGKVGRALLEAFEQRGWMHRSATGRAVALTSGGRAALERHFGPMPH